MALVAVLPSPEQSLFDGLVRERVSDSGLSMAAKANMEGGGGGGRRVHHRAWEKGKRRKPRGDLKFMGLSGTIAAHSWVCDDGVKREGESRQELTSEYRVLASVDCVYSIL